MGYPYTIEAIHGSELRILQTLKFNVNSRRSPSIYLMNFLKMLGKLLLLLLFNHERFLVRRKPELVDEVEVLYRFCLFCLDSTLLNRNQVYKKILSIAHSGDLVSNFIDASLPNFFALGTCYS